MEDAEPPEMCVLLRALPGSSHVTVLQIRQSSKEQLSFVPSLVRNDRQSLQILPQHPGHFCPHTRSSPSPNTAWAGGGHMQIKEQELPLALPADN